MSWARYAKEALGRGETVTVRPRPAHGRAESDAAVAARLRKEH